LSWLEPVYDRWLAERGALLKDPRCIEVRAEDLATDWPTKRRALFEQMGLPDEDTASGFDHASLQRHGRSVTADQAAEINRRLGWAIEQLGYPTTV
jgi:omega-hydroxy-beta-dihydromenaquinone-9 sulfotransferase